MLILTVFVLLILGCGVSLSLINATAVELFPTHLRGMAIATSILVGRMGTVVGANTIGFLLDWDCSYTYYGTGVLVLGELIKLQVLLRKGLCHFNGCFFQFVASYQLACRGRASIRQSLAQGTVSP